MNIQKKKGKWTEHEGFKAFDKCLKICKLTRKPVKIVCLEYEICFADVTLFLMDFPIFSNEIELFMYEPDDFDVGLLAEQALIYSLSDRIVKTHKREKIVDKDGNITIKTTTTERYIPPNPTLVKFALERLRRNEYGVSAIEITESTNGTWCIGTS